MVCMYFEEISVHLSKVNEELLVLREYVYRFGQCYSRYNK